MSGASAPAVPRRWPESTIVCIGGGPSLTADDVDYCRHRAPVVAINDAYRLAPWADVLYAADYQWWKWHKDAVCDFAGEKYTLQPQSTQYDPSVVVLQNTGEHGLDPDPGCLRTGRNSGVQAINVAIHLGAVRVLLLGYDMSRAVGGPTHWFGNHPNGVVSPYATFIERFNALPVALAALGVTVINCSRATALTCFPRQTIEEALP